MRHHIVRSNIFIIVDDEKHLTFSNDKMPQNVGFYAFDKEDASNNVKYKTKESYPEKDFSLVGIVIDRYFNIFYWYYKRSSR